MGAPLGSPPVFKHTTTMNDAEIHLVEFLRSQGEKIDPRDVREFGLTGNESAAEIEQYGRDYLCELHTERCEARNAWRYEL